MLGTSRPTLLLDPGRPAYPVDVPDEEPEPSPLPLLSCIMASRGGLFPAIHAIDCFRRQSYAPRELVIATAAGDGLLRDHVAALGDPRIGLVEVGAGASVGGLRNAAIARSAGALLATWDDDDMSHPDRLAVQYRTMRSTGARGCFLARVVLWWPARQMLAVSGARVWENTMLVERSVTPAYPADGVRGEDTVVAEALRASQRLAVRDVPEAYCYVAHGSNQSQADHFEMLFGNASRSYAGAAYDDVLAGLAAELPIAAYAAGLSGG